MAPVPRSAEILVVLAVALFFFGQTEGQITGFGSCPRVTPSATAVANTLSNTWFLNRKYFSPKELPLRCVSYVIGNPQGANNVLSFALTGRNLLLGIPVSLAGTATPVSAFNTYSAVIYGTPFFPNNYIVLGFGADWVVLWSCTDYILAHFQQLLILTTTRNPPRASIDAAVAVANANFLPTWLLIPIIQTGC